MQPLKNVTANRRRTVMLDFDTNWTELGISSDDGLPTQRSSVFLKGFHVQKRCCLGFTWVENSSSCWLIPNAEGSGQRSPFGHPIQTGRPAPAGQPLPDSWTSERACCSNFPWSISSLLRQSTTRLARKTSTARRRQNRRGESARTFHTHIQTHIDT